MPAWRAWLPLVLGGLLVLGPSESRAEPSIWQRASHPRARAEARLLRGLERLIDAEEQAESDPEFANHFARAAVAMLDLARVPAPDDPRLAVAMAHALVAAGVGRGKQAETLLAGAIARLPQGSLLAWAWLELGRARTERNDRGGARDAFARVLELEVDVERRALAAYARAQAESALGDLEPAAQDFEAAASGTSNELLRLRARYGLAMTLERRGDLPGALALAAQTRAVRLPLSRYPADDPLELPGGFDPAYDLHYVKALAWLSRARQADEAAERRAAYERAVREWDAYVGAAPPGTAWVGHARALAERAEAELRKLPAAKRGSR
jgi:tetratricopeptide (TPR) repeat protein